MVRTLRNAFTTLLFLTILTGIVYPAAVTGLSQAIFPDQANGSIITKNGRPVGSTLIGQQFDVPQYFWGRPSATSPYPCNGASSAGSNLGPNNPELIRALQARIARLKAADPGNGAAIPVDLVTASASGLDPHISPAAAEYQVKRIARARNLDESAVRALVEKNTQGRWLGVIGEPGVNVLTLNLALDTLRQPEKEKIQ